MLSYQDALAFLESNIAVIESEVYDKQYPEIIYDQLIPVVDEGEWAKTITFYHRDVVGQADWFNARGDTMPLADVVRGQKEQVIEMAAIGYDYSLEEIQQASMANRMLSMEKADAARFAYESFVDNVAFYGDERKGWKGLANQDTVGSISNLAEDKVIRVAADTKEGGTPGTAADHYWVNKKPQEIVDEVNNLVAGVTTDTNLIEQIDTLLLPPAEWAYIASKRISDYDATTILEQIQRSNVYTARTGMPLMIRGVVGLDNQATAGDNIAAKSARAVAYRRDPDHVRIHIPMMHRFLPPFQVSPITWEIGGIFRLGGVEVRRPGSMRYLDGIGKGGS